MYDFQDLIADRKRAATSAYRSHVVGGIECADGFLLSVQASSGHYCTPRDDDGYGLVWSAYEVGFPSERCDALMPYAENPNDPTETVYGWVPAEIIDAVINQHGGLKR